MQCRWLAPHVQLAACGIEHVDFPALPLAAGIFRKERRIRFGVDADAQRRLGRVGNRREAEHEQRGRGTADPGTHQTIHVANF